MRTFASMHLVLLSFFFFSTSPLSAADSTAVADPALNNRAAFVDVAAALGIDLMNVSGDSEQTYVIDTMMGGSAFFDYDRDGDVD